MKTVKVVHDRKNCIGCNACCAIAPQSWTMDYEDGKSHLQGAQQKGDIFVGEIFEADLEMNRCAAEACPVNIIKIGG